MPAGSPYLNPVEKFWSWLRREVKKKDLQDLVAGRPSIGKTAFKLRVQNIVSSMRAKRAAASCAGSLRKTADQVIRKKGAAHAVESELHGGVSFSGCT